MIRYNKGMVSRVSTGKKRWLALLITLAFFISGIATQSYYGLSWDEGLGNLFFGERYLLYLTTFAEKYLDFKANLAFHLEQPFNLYLSPFRDYPNEFPGFADTLSAGSMHLFSYKLGWMDPVDAWHLFTILLATIFLWVFYRFFAPRLGETVTLLGMLFLATFPRFWGDMHINPKDVPEMIFFGFVIMGYLAWYEKPNFWRGLTTGVLFGCALGIKANALFIPIILILGVLLPGFNKASWKQFCIHMRYCWWHYLVMGAAAAGTYIMSWPYLYANPFQAINYFRYILDQGSRELLTEWSIQPLQMVIFTMPEVMLFFFLAGLVVFFSQVWRERKPVRRMLLCWSLFPILRISMPGMINFDGIRHFMEFVPAAALISGYGVVALVNLVAKERRRLKKGLFAGIILLICINVAQIMITFHPFQYLYFNRVVGGMQGAKQFFGENEATDYWASSYRLGMRWINDNAEIDSVLYVPVAEWLTELTEQIWLRHDITLAKHDFADDLMEIPVPVYVMFVTRPGFYDQVAQYCVSELKPVYQIIVDGVSVLQIFRLNEPGV